jgi:signal transduction histidine kinase
VTPASSATDAGAPWLALGLAVLGALALILALDAYTGTPPPEPRLEVIRAERALGAHDATPPGADAAWTTVTLPDRAPFVDGAARQHAWYRLRVRLPEPGPPLWGVLLRQPRAALAIWIDGRLLADAGTTRERLPEYRHDLRYNLPPGVLSGRELELVVHSVAATRGAGLGPLWFADSARLAAYKAQRNRIEKTLPSIAVQVIVVLGVMFGAVFAARPREHAFGWFAAALLMWAAHTALLMRGTPLFGMPALARPLPLVTLAWFVVFALLFVHRWIGLRAPASERAALGAGMAGSALAFATSGFGGDVAYAAISRAVVVPAILLVGATLAWHLLQALRREPGQPDVRRLLVVAVALLVIGLRDWLFDAGWIGGAQSMRYLPFAAPLVFLAAGGMLLRRHVQALATAESLNRDLEAKVAEKSAQIERGFRQLAAIENERARDEERARIVRDMHDGVGGHLVQALAMAERGTPPERLRETLGQALDDLRLLIDAVDLRDGGLADALARLRERLARRLAALGLRLEWDFTTMPELPALPPETTIQVLRVLQELYTNVVKHAQARVVRTRVAIETHVGAAELVIEVEDDGVGFDVEAPSAGRGRRSLGQRVATIGAQLVWRSAPGVGTTARLSLPLPPKPEGDARIP